MTTLESNTVELNTSMDNIYNYLCNFNNFKHLMPSQVSEWSSTENECSFVIKGMATIGMKIIEKTPCSYIRISSHGKVPFDFLLHVKLNAGDNGKTQGQLVFEAELNPMIRMMVEKPLSNFVNLLAEKLKDIT